MQLGKYGQMIKDNMEKNYPIRTKDLIFKNEFVTSIYHREQEILELKKNVEKQVKEIHKKPILKDPVILLDYQQMVDKIVDEILIKEVLKKI